MQVDDIIKKITRGTTEIISVENLAKKLEKSRKTGKPLCIKAGFDPTAPDIHLGHCVLLKKLRQFQDLGHTVFFLIGDFTAQIGDPTGRDQTRPKMDRRQIVANAKTYQTQVFKILDGKKTKVVFNSSWLSKLNAQDILSLSARCSVAQMLARADFKKRFEQQKEISLLEFIYPLLQGYDSVHLKADVELGGSDQKFNLLMGRQLQETFGQEPQVVMMTPLLEGTDGVNKMSKSLGNYIGIQEDPKEIFGKVMSISDALMYRYYELLTNLDLEEIKKLHPKEAKLRLAEEIVGQFYKKPEAKAAREHFERTFSQRQIPEEDIVTHRFDPKRGEQLPDILVAARIASSKNEARRLINQGAVTCGTLKIDEHWVLQEGTLKIGKRRFLKLISAS
ncbi:MAG TPA: tyrosine--tRNA ligase [Candidatus Omnitrophota bacterium]|nr:tyrosine--tRNA ligase [Candidatus Omnitrophota bacterium]HPD83981.1 tyrosine--tRNA ligase [Candidatus Omnitrophota bacterium]HRZ02838.1 tyrosine--tRNA ligase [Candidatus Omnitrophota bacterium]